MADDFEFDVSKWAKKAGDRIEMFQHAFAEEIVNRLKENTPVVTGRMRAGWHAVYVDNEHTEIVNDVAYAHRVNSGFIGKDSLGRNFHQRGHHMVEQVIAEVPQIATAVLKEIK
jgi:hypothetical protein